MLTKWFKTKNVATFVVEAPTLEKEVEKVITSKDIQEDLHKSFEDVMKEFGLKESKETEIENLENKLKTFKKENEEVYSKIETLQNLGLTSTPSVVKSLEALKNKEHDIKSKVFEIETEISKAEKLKNLVYNYSLKYPCYKFIDNTTMFKIMEKYDLVLGDAFMYGREIPTENLEIINYFTSEIKESEEVMQLKAHSYSGRNVSYNFDKKEVSTKDENILMDDFYLQKLHYVGITSVVKEFKVSKFKIVAPENHFIIPTYHIADYQGDYKNVPLLSLDVNRKYKFDIRELEKIEAKKREVLDPIACLEVEGGYIIMTAWDKEAEIPEIKNNILN